MIENMAAASGRMRREDDTVINLADRLYITGTLIGDESSATFANSASANTQKTITITAPDNVRKTYLVNAYNPSTAAALTMKIFNMRTINSATRYSLLTTLTFAAASTVSGTTVDTYGYLVEGMFIASDAYIVVSNNTALGSSGGFTAYFTVREAD
ncbi:MAG: hypothetical protein H6Q73_930 [Firmicutes bacterium]|nr:hypothetical protein [Bacillota bacterium]